MKKRIGIITTEFGFGPVSKVSYIINEIKLKEMDYSIWFYGEEFSSEYIRKSNEGVEIIEYSKINDEKMGIKNCSIVINVMNTDLLQKWDSTYPRMYFVDSLSWMWDKPLQGIEQIDTYYIQDYLTNYEKVDEYKKYTTVKLLPPISEKKDTILKKRNLLLVNFSGVHNPYTDPKYFTSYCISMMDCILEEAEGKFQNICVSLNGKLANELRNYYQDKMTNVDLEFNFYSHEEFIILIREAEFIITNAGITTTLELCNYNRCFCYLLGTNYSQALMTQKYYEDYNMKNVLPFSMFGVDIKNLSELPEEDGVRLITSAVTRIINEDRNKIKKYFRKMLSMDREKISQYSMSLLPEVTEFGQAILTNDIKIEMDRDR